MTVSNVVPGYAFLDGGSVSLVLAGIESLDFDESLTEIVLKSEDVHDTYRAMAERGVPFEGKLGPSIMSREGRDLIAAHFRDPDGHYGRLTGWVTSEEA